MNAAGPGLITAALACALAAGGFSPSTIGSEQSDIGQADQATLEKVHPAKPPY